MKLDIKKVVASDIPALDAMRTLFQEYSRSLDVDLCFQNFEKELRELPGHYQEPSGMLLLATYDGLIAGCCAMRALNSPSHPMAAEMKRLYVRPEFRGRAIGRLLVQRIIEGARTAGYKFVILDTLKTMDEARALYQSLGFLEIPAYYDNPNAGTTYFKLDLSSAASLSSKGQTL